MPQQTKPSKPFRSFIHTVMSSQPVVRDDPEKLRKVIKTLVDMYVANRGRPDSEYISCITPRHATLMTRAERKADKYWRAWDAAREALGEDVVVPNPPPRKKRR